MPPTLILIRHAQALHNVASDFSLHDPPLSELGERQCAELQESLKKEDIANKVELIVVSPMRRTLQTAMLGLGWLIEKGVPVEADAGWQGMYAKWLLITLCCFLLKFDLWSISLLITIHYTILLIHSPCLCPILQHYLLSISPHTMPSLKIRKI
jgi:hypothetical protein